MNRYFLLVAVVGAVILVILGAVLGVEFAGNVPFLNGLLYKSAWAFYGAFLWDALNTK